MQLAGLSADFYRNALLYLSYTALESLSEEERLQMAFDLGISALVGEDLYSFGDLVSSLDFLWDAPAFFSHAVLVRFGHS